MIVTRVLLTNQIKGFYYTKCTYTSDYFIEIKFTKHPRVTHVQHIYITVPVLKVATRVKFRVAVMHKNVENV